MGISPKIGGTPYAPQIESKPLKGPQKGYPYFGKTPHSLSCWVIQIGAVSHWSPLLLGGPGVVIGRVIRDKCGNYAYYTTSGYL